MRRPLLAAALVLPFALVAVPADAVPRPKSYANCGDLNQIYRHGVARTLPKLDKNGKVIKKDGKIVYVKAKDRVRGSTKPVTNFTTSNKTYDYNNGVNSKPFKDKVQPKDYKGERDLDRDNDGIACEKL